MGRVLGVLEPVREGMKVEGKGEGDGLLSMWWWMYNPCQSGLNKMKTLVSQ
jgi:hypothetical protein